MSKVPALSSEEMAELEKMRKSIMENVVVPITKKLKGVSDSDNQDVRTFMTHYE